MNVECDVLNDNEQISCRSFGHERSHALPNSIFGTFIEQWLFFVSLCKSMDYRARGTLSTTVRWDRPVSCEGRWGDGKGIAMDIFVLY